MNNSKKKKNKKNVLFSADDMAAGANTDVWQQLPTPQPARSESRSCTATQTRSIDF